MTTNRIYNLLVVLTAVVVDDYLLFYQPGAQIRPAFS